MFAENLFFGKEPCGFERMLKAGNASAMDGFHKHAGGPVHVALLFNGWRIEVTRTADGLLMFKDDHPFLHHAGKVRNERLDTPALLHVIV